jgi:Ca2+-binding EF-hand superfamily protein
VVSCAPRSSVVCWMEAKQALALQAWRSKVAVHAAAVNLHRHFFDRYLRLVCCDWQVMSRHADAVTEAHRQQLRQVFDSYDRGDGYLGTAQMSKCFSKFGARMTEAELSDLINECGGQVDFNEFVFLMTRKFSDCNSRSEIESAFRSMDKDGDGVISAADAAASFIEMGQEQLASPEFLKELLREMQVRAFVIFDCTFFAFAFHAI